MQNEVITLTFVANESNLGMLRLVVSSLAARNHFDVDQIEDLTTAVCEVCMRVSAYARKDSQLTVRLNPGEEFVASAAVACAPEFSLPPNERSNYLIGQLVDDVNTEWKKGERLLIEIRLRKA